MASPLIGGSFYEEVMARQGSMDTGAERTRFSIRERNTGNPGGVSRNPRELLTSQGGSHEKDLGPGTGNENPV